MMNHLSQPELILYCRKFGLSSTQKKLMTEHLQSCCQCQIKFNELQSNANKMSKDNLKACRQIQKHLELYLDGVQDAHQAKMIEEHLSECDRCQQLYQLVVDLPDWEGVAIAEAEIPVSTQHKIESAVLQTLKKDSLKQKATRPSEKILAAIEGMVNRLILDFHPISPAVVFRGDQPDELKVIEHPGGDLHLATGLKNVTLKLTSIFEEFMLQRQTDDNGDVVFEDLAKGEYFASVSGYRLKDIKVHTKRNTD